jgi:CheY-like chemotaxis protein
MIVSRDWQEVSVLECILSSLHIDVDVEPKLDRAWERLRKSKIDALIVDCDARDMGEFLQKVNSSALGNPPIVIANGNTDNELAKGASFMVRKPVSVEQAVQTLSSARNLILAERLRYYRQPLDLPAQIIRGRGVRIKGRIVNLSKGGTKVVVREPLAFAEDVQLAFSLPGAKRAFKAEGRVAWSDKQGNSGIRFVAVPETFQKRLQLWIDQRYFREREIAR